MKNATSKDETNDVLFDGTNVPQDDEDGLMPSPAPSPPAPSPSPQATSTVPVARPEVIHPTHYRLRSEFDYKPGEDGWTYLDRITPLLLKELVAMASAPLNVINAKVKLDALKELIQRPMPARQVYDIRTPAAGSEFDRMSDAQVMDFVTKQIGDMHKDELKHNGILPVPKDDPPEE